MCNHQRAVDFWAESVVHHENFYAVASSNSNVLTIAGWDDFKNNKTDAKNIVLMGFSCPETARGSFYLQTNKASPFGRGMDGTHYDSSLE